MAYDISRIAFGSLKNTASTVLNSTNGVVIKTFLFGNNTANDVSINLLIDTCLFEFIIPAKDTFILDKTIVANTISAQIISEDTDISINYHISGIKLGDS